MLAHGRSERLQHGLSVRRVEALAKQGVRGFGRHAERALRACRHGGSDERESE